MVATAAATATANIRLATKTPEPTAVASGLLALLPSLPWQRLVPTPGQCDDTACFADYVPTDSSVARKVESTLVHLLVSDSKQTAMHDVRDTRDSAYPSAPATFAVAGGITVLEGWTNDRQPPSYFLGWVEHGAQTLEVYLDTTAAGSRTDRTVVKQQAIQVATALAGHMSR